MHERSMHNDKLDLVRQLTHSMASHSLLHRIKANT